MAWFWLCLAIALLVVELSTTQLICVWFAIGAGVTALFKAIIPTIGTPWQLVIFVVVSVGLLLGTRRIVKKFLTKRGKDHETNLELTVGKEAVVVEEIDNVNGKGAVKINGLVWSARSVNGEKMYVGETVIFKEINGNKAMVERKGE